MVLCMTVNPGWGGQAFLDSSLAKLQRIRELVGDTPAIQVDGGIERGHGRALRRRRGDRVRRRDGRFRDADPADAVKAISTATNG